MKKIVCALLPYNNGAIKFTTVSKVASDSCSVTWLAEANNRYNLRKAKNAKQAPYYQDRANAKKKSINVA